MLRRFIPLLFVLELVACGGASQIFESARKADEVDPEKPDISYEKEETDTLADVDLKVKKNFYYGEKVKKAFTRTDNSTGTTFQLFNVLKEPVKVDNYVQEIYYWDPKADRVVAVVGKGQTLENVLHGPYERTVNDNVLDKGMFIYGMKHERWLHQNSDSTLSAKQHFHMGWFRDSEITYYDEATKEKIKEVIPIQYGKKEGYYYRFYESGKLAVKGQYVFDRKVGVWEEYYDSPGSIVTLKKTIQYRPEFYMKDYKSFVRREWDEYAQPIYSSPRLSQ